MNNAFGCNTEDPQQWSGVNRKSILIFSGPKTHLRALDRDQLLEIRKVIETQPCFTVQNRYGDSNKHSYQVSKYKARY